MSFTRDLSACVFFALSLCFVRSASVGHACCGEQVRRHAATVGCGFVVGYREVTSICGDLCVLSAYGTAAKLSRGLALAPSLAPPPWPVRAVTADATLAAAAAAPTRGLLLDAPPLSLGPAASVGPPSAPEDQPRASENPVRERPATDAGERQPSIIAALAAAAGSRANGEPPVASGFAASSESNAAAAVEGTHDAARATPPALAQLHTHHSHLYLHAPSAAVPSPPAVVAPPPRRLRRAPCAIAHVPYRVAHKPFEMRLAPCGLCGKRAVPEFILATVEAPPPHLLPVVGVGQVCTAWRETEAA